MYILHKIIKISRSNGVWLVLIALLTAIASEIKVIPFNGESFRFGLGSITFFFLILIRTPASLIQTGLVTGLTVVGVRVVEDMVMTDNSLVISCETQFPVFMYYFLFAFGLHLIQVERYKMMPLILGAWATLFEFVGNGAEQLIREFLLSKEFISIREIALLGVVALFRSYFVVGLYSSITVSEQKKRMQEMLDVGSGLYAETLYMQKSMNEMEQITLSSHDLYKKLKKEGFPEYSEQALNITQQIHEVKKDSQRILAGLSKITKRKRKDVFFLSELMDFVVIGNEKYSEYLSKSITFHVVMSTDMETDQHMPLLALLNNLTANAVESIIDRGEIELKLFEEAEQICLVIKDSGVGILEEDILFIFEPGYTTKYNDQGVAATGIGLSHVQDIIHALEGGIQFEKMEKGTVCKIQIPTRNIRK